MTSSIRERLLQGVMTVLAPVALAQGAVLIRSPPVGVTREQSPALLFFQASDVDARTGQIRPRRIRGSNGQMIELLPCTKPQGCLTYAGAGVMALDDIAERLFVLLSKEPGTDF